jgi:hypothetical protein
MSEICLGCKGESLTHTCKNKELMMGIQKLLGKINRVTSSHRHGVPINPYDLTDLSNYQIDFENLLESQREK